jgi:predicted acyltransferase
MAIVSTIASPVAWSHHYGILLPIFVWLWFSEYSEKNKGWNTVLLATAYVLIADRLVFMNLLWNIPVANLLQSYTYFGGILVLFLLTRTHASPLALPRLQAEAR